MGKVVSSKLDGIEQILSKTDLYTSPTVQSAKVGYTVYHDTPFKLQTFTCRLTPRLDDTTNCIQIIYQTVYFINLVGLHDTP